MPDELEAGHPPHPLADPGRFLSLSRPFASSVEARLNGAVTEPAPCRPAATVAIVREGEAGVETLLLHRPANSRFAPDAWVFPGGAVDRADATFRLDARAEGPRASWWAARLGLPDFSEATGYLVAAVREAWEEAGIALIAPGSAVRHERLEAARADLLAGRKTLEGVLEREAWRLDLRDLLYIAHWITPEPEPRRYDTRFFLTRVPPDTVCALQGGELDDARWVRPADAVRRFLAGELRFLPPTIHVLNRLAGHATVQEIWREMREAPVPRILPANAGNF